MKKNFTRTIYTKQDAGAFFMFSLFAPQITGAILLFLISVVSLLFGINHDALLENPITVIIQILTIQSSFLLVFWLYNKALRFDGKKASKIFFKNGFINIFLAIVLGFVTLYGFQYIISFIDDLIKLLNLPQSELPLPLNTWYWLIINIVLLAFVPAVCEELVFRGVIFNGLMQYTSKKENGKSRVWIAIVGSALLFALIHMNVEQTMYPLIFGIVLGILAYKTKSIIPGMVAHFVNNAFVLVLNFLNEINVFNQEEVVVEQGVAYYITGIIYAVIAFVIVWSVSKALSPNKQSTITQVSPELVQDTKIEEQITINHDIEALEKASKQPNLFLWVGVGFGLLFWILSLFS